MFVSVDKPHLLDLCITSYKSSKYLWYVLQTVKTSTTYFCSRSLTLRVKFTCTEISVQFFFSEYKSRRDNVSRRPSSSRAYLIFYLHRNFDSKGVFFFLIRCTRNGQNRLLNLKTNSANRIASESNYFVNIFRRIPKRSESLCKRTEVLLNTPNTLAVRRTRTLL